MERERRGQKQEIEEGVIEMDEKVGRGRRMTM